jgi:hypothetical protein
MYNIFMVKYKGIFYILIILLFLGISYYPTYFELEKADKLKDPAREFILEHNFYWPDFNLYLSKIRQGFEGKWTGQEKYTSEPHKGSLIQEFYVFLGRIGGIMDLNPNHAYQLGRAILSPLLLIVVLLFILYYFKSTFWQIIGFTITLVSGSFPRFYSNSDGVIQVGRFMEWWSNIDAVQRISFLPHIVFGQVTSLFILYELALCKKKITINRLILYAILGNLTGLVFPPSLITLNGVLMLIILIYIVKSTVSNTKIELNEFIPFIYFIIFCIPSLLYILILTKQMPWSSLVDFHRTHPMMIPFWDYILGTGPIFFLGAMGAVLSIINRDKKFQPLILWVIVTFGFALLFTHIKEQSPLRFTQTGLFIPLGILGTYFFKEFCHLPDKIFAGIKLQTEQVSNLPINNSVEKIELVYIVKAIFYAVLFLYIAGNFYMMHTSIKWQTNFITQRVGANIPPVPYPPQTMYPLKEWMDGIRWLRNNTDHDDVVVAAITAGNHIPAYSGNTVYFGQSNTVNYETKQILVNKFFEGKMSENEAQIFLKNGRIKYIFFSVQEKEISKGTELTKFYPFLKSVYTNPIVNIYTY